MGRKGTPELLKPLAKLSWKRVVRRGRKKNQLAITRIGRTESVQSAVNSKSPLRLASPAGRYF